LVVDIGKVSTRRDSLQKLPFAGREHVHVRCEEVGYGAVRGNLRGRLPEVCLLSILSWRLAQICGGAAQ
jgi:hypothetical protein